MKSQVNNIPAMFEFKTLAFSSRKRRTMTVFGVRILVDRYLLKSSPHKICTSDSQRAPSFQIVSTSVDETRRREKNDKK